ncbi:uncharacterized protein LOC114308305 [Camellia sinensis]|uniref:uncharacterized protein LOC114308305 n=1 Tax=Camellia sinensis TaxID=4442 RepID=UPI0010365C68|nr:uncharacterized protein LOC114308305 [Camellia sinensis]
MGASTIAYIIGDYFIDRALLDFGASVNLLPYSVYEEFGLGKLKPITVTLQLADCSLKVPRGMIENALVKVDRFYFLVDFVVLVMEPIASSRKQIPMILARPFLAMANACINCHAGVVDVPFGNMQVKLNVFQASQLPHEKEECLFVDIVGGIVNEALPSILIKDPLEACLAHFGFDDFDIDRSVEEVNALHNSSSTPDFPPWKVRFESLPPLSRESAIPSLITPHTLELKPFLTILKYAFLRHQDTLPVIIASNLTA